MSLNPWVSDVNSKRFKFESVVYASGLAVLNRGEYVFSDITRRFAAPSQFGEGGGFACAHPFHIIQDVVSTLVEHSLWI